MKRRYEHWVNVVDTPSPQWDGGGCAGWETVRMLSLIHPAQSRQLRVAMMSFVLELGNSHAAEPPRGGRHNASARTGGRRRRSRQTPGCNGSDRVKVRQGKPGEPHANG